MRIAKIGGITLDYKLWVDNHQSSKGVEAEVVKNLDGGVIVFEQLRRISSDNIVLMSGEDGWQKTTTVEALVALSNGSLGASVVIEDEDGGTFNARFRHEQTGGAVQFSRLVQSKLFDWYTGTIFLARV